MRITPKSTILLLLAAHAALLVLFARTRLVDGDEGFYLSAAREVAAGNAPYVDFCYPQMPLLPYVYSAVSESGFDTLYYSRYLSITVALLTAFLIVMMLKRRRTLDSFVVVALVLYAFSGLVLSWHTVTKAYPWTNLLLLAGLLAVFEFSRARLPLWALLSGLMFGLAANFRLTLLPMIIPAAAFIAIRAGRSKILSICLFLAGALVASLHSLSLLAQDPRSFWFDNFGFHLMRNPGVNFWQSVVDRSITLAKLAVNPQIMIIGLLLIAAILAFRRNSVAFRFKALFESEDHYILLMGAFIILIHLIPSPIHQQYFTQAIPFAILLVPKGLEYITQNGTMRKASSKLIKIVCLVYILGLVPYFVVFIGGVRSRDNSNRIKNVKALCDNIAASGIKGPLYSEWPLIPVLTNRGSIANLEFIAYDYDYPLAESEKRRYHLPISSEIREALLAAVPSFCIVYDTPHVDFRDAIISNYELAGSFERYKVYKRKEFPVPPQSEAIATMSDGVTERGQSHDR